MMEQENIEKKHGKYAAEQSRFSMEQGRFTSGQSRATADQGKVVRQEIKMLNRKVLEISGVLNVDSFDSEQFLLETECGFLTITGENLHIKNLILEQGRVAIEGMVHSMTYLDSSTHNKSKSLLGKLFK